MIEFAIFTYGMLATFVLSGASRNRKEQRANSRMLELAGYFLCGFSAAAAVGLLLLAATGRMDLLPL